MVSMGNFETITGKFNALETKVVETVCPETQTHRRGSESVLPRRAVCALHHDSNFTVTESQQLHFCVQNSPN